MQQVRLSEFARYFFMDPALLADPYPMYDRLREADSVQFDETLQVWILTGHAAVTAALRDSRMRADRMSAGREIPSDFAYLKPVFDFIAHQMLFKDPPDHTRLRTLASKAFTPRRIELMRAQIQAIVDELIDAALPAGRMDVIADLAVPLPTTVIIRMLGVPESDRERFKRWSDDFAAFLGTRWLSSGDAALRSLDEVRAYLRDLIAARRGNLGTDLVSAMIAAEEQGDVLSDEELHANILLLLAAGHETTTNLIGNGLHALLRHPDQLQRLREQPELAPSAVEELLRFDSPVQNTGRLAGEDLEIGGKRIAKGQFVVCQLAAANHDPAQFAEPGQLDIARRDNRHLAFGFGSHFCFGAPLARLEGQVAFETLLRRLPELRLADDAAVAYTPNITFRGLQSLPVAF